ncbi:MAG: hypothetical protein Q9165_006320 [Trypethelium subeluteriae]
MFQTPQTGPMARQMSGTANIAFKRRVRGMIETQNCHTSSDESKIKFQVQGRFDGDDPLKTISEIALKLRLSGFVKVGPRGLPEGEAQGDEDRLNSFVQRIKRQLPAENVTDVESSEISAKYETLVAEYKNKFFGGGFRVV